MADIDRVLEVSVFKLPMMELKLRCMAWLSRDSEAHRQARQVSRRGRPPTKFLEHEIKIPPLYFLVMLDHLTSWYVVFIFKNHGRKY